MRAFGLLLAIAAASSAHAANLPTVSVGGNAFWTTGKRFYLRGIDYKPGGNSENVDPLADTRICKRDVEYFKDLGVNAIRVYAIDNTADHDECMKLLDNAGVYVLVDVNTPKHSLNSRSWFDAYLSYNTKYLKNVFATVSVMSRYNNTLAFFSGNEIIDDEKKSEVAPFIKAVTRDIKNYQIVQNLRRIPVGYSAADVTANRVQTAMYLNCGPDESRSDFFAFNDYSWCNSDFLTAGWDKKVETFSDYGIPLFLSEYGCTKNRPRTFRELESLMHENMTSVYSGGMMFEFSNEDNNYGIVQIKGDSATGTVEAMKEFENMKSALSRYPAPTGGSAGATTTHSVSCPTREAGKWDVDPSPIPIIPRSAEVLMTDGVEKGDGLESNSKGTQLPECQKGESVEVCGLSPGNTTDSQIVSGSGRGKGGSSDKGNEDGAGLMKPPLIMAVSAVTFAAVLSFLTLI